jgi:hypothetical protein
VPFLLRGATRFGRVLDQVFGLGQARTVRTHQHGGGDFLRRSLGQQARPIGRSRPARPGSSRAAQQSLAILRLDGLAAWRAIHSALIFARLSIILYTRRRRG